MATWRQHMTSYQALLWREMAKEAQTVADQTEEPGLRRELLDGVTGWQQPNVAVGCGRPSE